MKKCIYLILIASATNYIWAQTILHEWKVTLKAVNEVGQPIADADASVGYFSNHVGTSIKGLTDTNGIFTASHLANSGLLSFSVVKEGYYKTWSEYDLGFDYNPNKWSPTRTIVLKKIGKPVPMYARKMQIEIPEINKLIGFDLMEADWVAPYGKGKQSDFIIEAQRRWASRNDFDSNLKVTFPNSGDGLMPISVPLNQGSELRLSATAPSDGYIPELSKSLSHTPATGWKKDDNKEQNYYFRVRTRLDESSNAKNAVYGKIYGDFVLDPINSKTTWIIFTYYLNPEPNSHNVEFDPKQNLFKNLSASEQVDEP